MTLGETMSARALQGGETRNHLMSAASLSSTCGQFQIQHVSKPGAYQGVMILASIDMYKAFPLDSRRTESKIDYNQGRRVN